MFSIGFILLVVIVAVLLIRKIAGGKKVQEDLRPLSYELVALLTMVREFASSPYWKDETGLVMVIPVNANGDLYRPGADRIRVSVLLLRDDLQSIQVFSQRMGGVPERFQLVQEGRNFSYMVTSNLTFQSDYKKVMPVLYSYVERSFPEMKLSFDGSRIMIKNIAR